MPSKSHGLYIIHMTMLCINLAVNIYFYTQNLELIHSQKRADIGVLIETATVTTENWNLTVKGNFCNEGGRSTGIESIEFEVKTWPNGDTIVWNTFFRSYNLTAVFNWEDSVLAEEKIKSFLFTRVIQHKEPCGIYEGFVRISHWDGIGMQKQSMTFFILPVTQ